MFQLQICLVDGRWTSLFVGLRNKKRAITSVLKKKVTNLCHDDGHLKGDHKNATKNTETTKYLAKPSPRVHITVTNSSYSGHSPPARCWDTWEVVGIILSNTTIILHLTIIQHAGVARGLECCDVFLLNFVSGHIIIYVHNISTKVLSNR